MGMDVYGKNPTTTEGEYFRNNVWWWRPLADYVEKVAPELYAKCEYWGINAGDGLNAEDSLALAEKLQAEIDSGRCVEYEKERAKELEEMADIGCDLCEGTGIRMPVPQRGAGDAATGIKCNACDGSGKVRPWQTQYPFSEENVKEFVQFLRGCGGFEIC